MALSEIDKDIAKQDLRFSQWFCWGFRFSGMWCCVAGLVFQGHRVSFIN